MGSPLRMLSHRNQAGLDQEATRSRRSGLAVLVLAVLLAPSNTQATGLPRGAALEVPLGRAAAVVSVFPDLREDEAPGLALRVQLRWDEVEPVSGLREWDRLERLLSETASRGVPVILVLSGPGPEGLGVPVRESEAMERWLEFVAEATELSASRVSAIAIWDRANDPAAWGRPPSVKEYAYLLKKTALAIKAVDPSQSVVQGALVASLSFQDDLFSEGVGPFLDAYGVDLGEAQDAAHLRDLLESSLREHDPSAVLWVHGEALDADPLSLWEGALSARAAGLALASFSSDASGTPLALCLGALAKALPADAAPAVSGGERHVSFPSSSPATYSRFVVSRDFSQRLAYRASGERTPGEAIEILIESTEVGAVQVHDPLAEFSGRVDYVLSVPKKGHTRIRIPLAARTLVLELARSRPEESLEEELSVVASRTPSVEEILARHLEVQGAQKRSLENFVADLTTEMRYQLGSTGRSVEVRIEGRTFRRADGSNDIEWDRYYLNGAPWKTKKGFPKLPLLQPERVTVVPLDVHLDRSYSYRLEGRDLVGKRAAWRVSFNPLTEEESRLSGTVWIDTETFERLKVRSVTTQVEAPILSDEQTDFFETVTDSSGRSHRVVTQSNIQRSVSLLGATVVVDIRMAMSGHRVNEPDFDAVLAEAHASPKQMLRDTKEGFRYLERQEDGSREVGNLGGRKIFAVAGFRLDDSYEGIADGLLPLVGFNWLDHDFRGKGLQLNMLVAGAVNTFSLSDPTLFGGKLQGGIDLYLPFISQRDQLRTPGQGIDDAVTVKSREPQIRLDLSLPIGAFAKVSTSLRVDHATWKEGDDLEEAFVLPDNGATAGLRLVGEFHRLGWEARAWVQASRRSNWEEWGEVQGVPGAFEESHRDYWTWAAKVGKSWSLPHFQRFTAGLDYYGGSSLDRFSQHEFGLLAGPQLAGFAGSGIHFDKGGILHLAHEVNVAGRLGLAFQVDLAQTQNSLLSDDILAEAGSWSKGVGVALSGTLPGPWGTFMTFEVGHALYSDDYEGAEGGTTMQFLVWKLVQ